MRSLVLALLLAALPLSAAELPPEAAPRTEARRFNPGLLGAGVGTLWISYGSAFVAPVVYAALIVPFFAAAHARVPTEPFLLFVPFAGPVLLARTDALAGNGGAQALFYVDAGAQVVGLALVLAGLAAGGSEQEAHAGWRPLAFPGGAGLARRF